MEGLPVFCQPFHMLCLSVCYETVGENRSLSLNQGERSTVTGHLQIIHGWSVRTLTAPRPRQPLSPPSYLMHQRSWHMVSDISCQIKGWWGWKKWILFCFSTFYKRTNFTNYKLVFYLLTLNQGMMITLSLPIWSTNNGLSTIPNSVQTGFISSSVLQFSHLTGLLNTK